MDKIQAHHRRGGRARARHACGRDGASRGPGRRRRHPGRFRERRARRAGPVPLWAATTTAGPTTAGGVRAGTGAATPIGPAWAGADRSAGTTGGGSFAIATISAASAASSAIGTATTVSRPRRPAALLGDNRLTQANEHPLNGVFGFLAACAEHHWARRRREIARACRGIADHDGVARGATPARNCTHAVRHAAVSWAATRRR